MFEESGVRLFAAEVVAKHSEEGTIVDGDTLQDDQPMTCGLRNKEQPQSACLPEC